MAGTWPLFEDVTGKISQKDVLNHKVRKTLKNCCGCWALNGYVYLHKSQDLLLNIDCQSY